MRDWVVTDEGDRWTVKLDVRDLGGHLDTTFRGWSSTLATRVRVVIARLAVVFAFRKRSRTVMCLCRFCGGDDSDGHLFWDCTFPPLVEIRENPEFHELM